MKDRESIKSAAPGRRARRAVETRLHLFRVAMRLFAQKGVANVSVSEITEEADVGKGTFFNYFESKEQVLTMLADIQLGKVLEMASQAQSGRLTIRTTLYRLMLSLSEESEESHEAARTLMAAYIASESVRSVLERRVAESRGIIAGLVDTGQRRGEIDRRLNRESVALEFQKLWVGTLMLWSLQGKESLKAWVDESFQYFWRSVEAVR